MNDQRREEEFVTIPCDGVELEGMLGIPAGSSGIVLFAHGSGSSRHSSRNNQVARRLREAGIGTLLFDLLTEQEGRIDRRTREMRFDIDLLTRRLAGATEWLLQDERSRELPLGYFGASTGAAAALRAAAAKPPGLCAVVSRGGRPDLAGDALPGVSAPVLLIVGGRDTQVIEMNRHAAARLGTEDKKIKIVEGATHLFEEPGKLEEVANLACAWFQQWFAPGC